MKTLFMAFLLMLPVANLWAVEDAERQRYEKQGWSLKRDHERTGTQVYLRDEDDSEIKSFLAVTIVDTDMPTLIALFNDAEAVPQWVHRIRQMDILRRVSETEMIQYSVTSTPPPARDRDMLLRSWVDWHKKTGVVEIHSKGIVDDSIKPEVSGKVRMTDVETHWRLYPISAKQTRVEFEGHGDPAGFLPVWLVNMVLHQSPYFTMKKLHTMVQDPKYTKAAANYQEYAYKAK